MPAPTTYKPIDLEKPGLKRVAGGGKKIRPVSGSFELIEVPAPRKFGKEELKGGVQRLTQRLVDYLNHGDRFERLMAETKLKDLGVLLGITTEKLLLLEGQPTQIISQQQHQKLDEVLPKLMEEMKRRGVKADLTERKVSLTLPSQDPS